MKLINFRLSGDDGQPASFQPAAHMGSTISPKYIVMHYTAGGSAEGTAKYFASPEARASAHFIIGRDGAIIQQVDCNRAAWHAGKSQWRGLSGLNRCSIGIELSNWGMLRQGADGYVSQTGAPVERSRIIMAAHKNAPGRIEAWEMYPEAQLAAAERVAAALVDAFGLEEDAIIGHDDIAPNRKIDPGPAFDMRAFRGRVAGRGSDAGEANEFFTVSAASGLNLRAGPGLSFAPVALLGEGTRLRAIAPAPEEWRLVCVQSAGADGLTGYAHSAWLVEAA